MDFDELSSQVRTYVRAALASRYQGELHVNKVRPQAYADGYMRALADAGLFSQSELLELVAEARAEVNAQAEAQPSTPRIAAVG
jgi:hypothetical protein